MSLYTLFNIFPIYGELLDNLWVQDFLTFIFFSAFLILCCASGRHTFLLYHLPLLGRSAGLALLDTLSNHDELLVLSAVRQNPSTSTLFILLRDFPLALRSVCPEEATFHCTFSPLARILWHNLTRTSSTVGFHFHFEPWTVDVLS